MSCSLSSYLQEGQQQVHLKQIKKNQNKPNFLYLKTTPRKGSCTCPMKLTAMPIFKIFLFTRNFSADNNWLKTRQICIQYLLWFPSLTAWFLVKFHAIEVSLGWDVPFNDQRKHRRKAQIVLLIGSGIYSMPGSHEQRKGVAHRPIVSLVLIRLLQAILRAF